GGRQLRYKLDTIQCTDHSSRRPLHPLCRRDRSLYVRHSIQQSRLQIRKHPAQRPSSLQNAANHLSMRTKFNYKQSGSTLAVVISTLAILMAIVACAVYYTTTVNRNTQRTTTLQTALAVGDSAIEVLFNNWRSTCRTFPTTVYKSSDLTAIPTPSPFPNMPSSNFVKRGSGIDP